MHGLTFIAAYTYSKTLSNADSAMYYGNGVIPDFSAFRSSVRGPWGQSETGGIIKNTKLSERFTLQIRADAYNIFNRVIRGDPDTNMGDGPLFGRITSDANGPRVLQFAARLNF